MKLSEITTDLEISKRLKEKGFPQDSLYCWIGFDMDGVKPSLISTINFEDNLDSHHAPTAEEILKELPKDMGSTACWGKLELNCVYDSKEKLWFIFYGTNHNFGDVMIERHNDKNIETFNKKLCHALALLWEYLYDNDLLEVAK